MSHGRILVIRGGAIGDFILTLPVLAALRSHLPEARLEVLGYPHIAQLALLGGLAEDVKCIEAGPLAGFFAKKGNLDPSLQEYFAGFSIIISFLYDPDGIFLSNVARCSKATFLPGPHRPDEAEGVHATQFFLKPLERLAIFEADPVPRICFNSRIEMTSKPLLALHPGSGSARKNWVENKWSRLLQILASTTTWDFLLIGGEAEGEKLDRLACSLPAPRLRIARSLPLAELAEVLAQCHGFVGHDSGISHLAAAVGLKVLVLWGHTSEAVWSPLGSQVNVLRSANSLAGLSVETVVKQIALLLPFPVR